MYKLTVSTSIPCCYFPCSFSDLPEGSFQQSAICTVALGLSLKNALVGSSKGTWQLRVKGGSLVQKSPRDHCLS